jgi:hypothetical protein
MVVTISTINACCSISSGNTVTVANGNTLGLVLIIRCGYLDFRKQCGTLSIRRSSYQYGNYSAKAKNDTNPENGLYLLVYSCCKSKLIDVSPNTRLDKFYSFNAGLDSWLNEDANAVMTLGKDILYVAQNLFGFRYCHSRSGIYRSSE